MIIERINLDEFHKLNFLKDPLILLKSWKFNKYHSLYPYADSLSLATNNFTYMTVKEIIDNYVKIINIKSLNWSNWMYYFCLTSGFIEIPNSTLINIKNDKNSKNLNNLIACIKSNSLDLKSIELFMQKNPIIILHDYTIIDGFHRVFSLIHLFKNEKFIHVPVLYL